MECTHRNRHRLTDVRQLSLSTHKRKDDLLTITDALQIITTGTVPQLTARSGIKEHPHTHPDLASNPRFAGLFRQGGSGPRHANILGPSHSEPTMVIPAASLLLTPSSHVPINESNCIYFFRTIFNRTDSQSGMAGMM